MCNIEILRKGQLNLQTLFRGDRPGGGGGGRTSGRILENPRRCVSPPSRRAATVARASATVARASARGVCPVFQRPWRLCPVFRVVVVGRYCTFVTLCRFK